MGVIPDDIMNRGDFYEINDFISYVNLRKIVRKSEIIDICRSNVYNFNILMKFHTFNKKVKLTD